MASKKEPAKKATHTKASTAQAKRVKPAKANGVTADPVTGLTGAEEVFACELAKGVNQSEAYRTAFPNSLRWAPATVWTKASLLAGTEKVKARVADLQAATAKQHEADVGLVLGKYLGILKADERKLSEVWVGACRHCHGINHRYQRTDGEFADDKDAHEEKRQMLLDAGKPDIGEFKEKGGPGYTGKLKPNPECPSCWGAGQSRVVLHDSREYDAETAVLFRGAKDGKDGREVKIADKDAALDRVARHVGFFEAQGEGEHTASPSDEELDAIYEQAALKMKAKTAAAVGRMERVMANMAAKEAGRMPPAEGDGAGDGEG